LLAVNAESVSQKEKYVFCMNFRLFHVYLKVIKDLILIESLTKNWKWY